MKKILKYFWKENILIVLIMIGSGIATTFASIMNASILNALVELNFNSFLKGVGVLLLSYSLFLLFTFLRIRYSSVTIQKMSDYIRKNIMDKVANSTYTSYKKQNSNVYASWLTNDIVQIEQQAFSPLYELINGVILSIISLISLFYIHWSLVVLTIVEVFILMLLPNIFSKSIQNATLTVAKQNEEFLSKVSDILSAYDTLFSFRKFDYAIEKKNEAAQKLIVEKNKYNFLMSKVAILGGIGNVVSQVSIFALTGYLAFVGNISIGFITSTGAIASSIFNTVGNLGQYIATINSVAPLFKKVESLDYHDNKETISDDITHAYSLKNLSFKYEERNILNDVTFTFDLNKKYAIVGDSGTGKSTLLNILGGKINNYSGNALLDNKEISDLTYDSVYKKVAYIEQKPHIFDSSIRENLCLGEYFTDTELFKVLEKVELLEDIKKLPNGLDAHLGQNGKNISGGQLQRLAIARALLRKKEIILLDESTSNLDSITANEIEELLVNDSSLTIIMITHHLSDKVKSKLDGILYL